MAEIDKLLPLVNEDTPETDPNSITLVLLSNLAADYAEAHYPVGEPSRMCQKLNIAPETVLGLA